MKLVDAGAAARVGPARQGARRREQAPGRAPAADPRVRRSRPRQGQGRARRGRQGPPEGAGQPRGADPPRGGSHGERDRRRSAPPPPMRSRSSRARRRARSVATRSAWRTCMVGNTKDAQPQLEQAVADLGDDAPNPLAYRTYTSLAELALANNDSQDRGRATSTRRSRSTRATSRRSRCRRRSCSRSATPTSALDAARAAAQGDRADAGGSS